MNKVKYDLEERLLDFASSVMELVDSLPASLAGRHVAGQFLRSGTSPYPNHGEAQAVESQKDFIHKMRVCPKELRETYRWLRLVERRSLAPDPSVGATVIRETDELIRIFVASIKTAETRIRNR